MTRALTDEDIAAISEQLLRTGSASIRVEFDDIGGVRHTVEPLGIAVTDKPVAVLAECAQAGYDDVVVVGLRSGSVYLSTSLPPASMLTLGALMAAGEWVERNLPGERPRTH